MDVPGWILGISIHALLAESDPVHEWDRLLSVSHISIHALLAESDCARLFRLFLHQISIHALLAESDVMYSLILADTMLFLSTLSLRRATRQERLEKSEFAISIHALLAESDKTQTHEKE